MADFKIEKKILSQSFQRIAGVDEAGRGALFGPVVAAAVVLPPTWISRPVRGWLRQVNDSKMIAPLKRRELARSILAEADSVGVGLATSLEIDEKNIYWASLEAMKRAVADLAPRPDFLLVDGFKRRECGFGCPQLGITGGDRKSLSVAAASIVAKVVRDEMMRRLEDFFTGYHLARNKGYGTKEHYLALRDKGPTPLHRHTFNLEGKAGWG
ncbi:MAG: ribonuclease HII [Candidatus Aminicenantes bacterium RBG_19FT_COMBO_58_17]|jgi:ribonuclease HII|nr:MAG: ribonuclease HII [Candidatus Aminicenantes bacterium RBG_19FT_COMBO_58_17]